MENQKRCINIDWLELYCQESNDHYPVNAQYYRDHGYEVIERDYGTRQYKEMFVICDRLGVPFVEVRRNPVSGDVDSRNTGMFNPLSCHIRVVNRYCYHDNIVTLFSEFLMMHNYYVSRIYRLDLCLDFEKFDKGDNPQDVLKRYMKGTYTKINQSNVSAHGKDHWESREWNSLSWGSPKSMVSTKFYNKTKELSEGKDKPYIRMAWQRAGLISDWIGLCKVADDGSIYHPDIWRVEFSIKSSARAWYRIENCNGRKTSILKQEHTLATYATKIDQLKAFANLAHHYFHFKIFEEGVSKYKCKNKVLFDFGNHEVYHLDVLLAERPKDTSMEALRKRLKVFKVVHPDVDVRNACDVLLKYIERLQIRDSFVYPYSDSDKQFLQFLLARRMNFADENLADAIKKVEDLMKLPDELF